MMIAAIIVSTILVALALLHVLWGIGYWWPIRDEATLVRAVAGANGITKMPGAVACSMVAVALLAAAWWPWFGSQFGVKIYALGLAALAVVFLLRGFAAYVPAWRRMWPEQPFASYDQRYYGPLCFALGLLFLNLLRGAI